MRKSMTYGTLPSREEFDVAFRVECPNGVFEFTNDRRVGSIVMSANRLWDELVEAQSEWKDAQTPKRADTAGQWCSDVLGVLGFEWI